MLNKIIVRPLAAESLGVRSMCTLVETPDARFLFDAGMSLSPNRFGLLPHPSEFSAIERLRKRIASAADRVEVVTVSHYHYDHHTPSYEDWLVNWTEAIETARQIYQDKLVLAKNPRSCINSSQRRRAWLFAKTGGKFARKLQSADGMKFNFGKDTVLSFSEPVTHGPDDTSLGWVTMAEVEYGEEVFLFAPDVQGPMSQCTVELIKKINPELLLIGGPPLYLSNLKVDEQLLEEAIRNLERIVKLVPTTILEHHVLREGSWKERMKLAFEAAAEVGHEIFTAAEFAGDDNTFLESNRRELYATDPPSNEFEHWTKLSWAKKGTIKPPL